MNEIAAAARRVAEQVRLLGYDGVSVDTRRLQILLPVLDGAAAEPSKGRVAGMAEVICRAGCRQESHVCDRDSQGDCLPGKCPHRLALEPEARAAIALADAEKAVRDIATLAVLRQLEWVDSGGNECAVCFGLRSRGHEPGCTLDAVVRTLSGQTLP